jgi:ribosomal protein S4
MIYKKNRRYKPIYKKFLALKETVLYSEKILKFKRRKWKDLISQLERLRKKNPPKYKLYDHTLYFLPKYSNYFKNNFRYNLKLKQRLSLIYGKLLKRYLKKKIFSILTAENQSKLLRDKSLKVLEFFENRLDTLLYRSHFVSNIKIARQLILHKHITINDIIITKPLTKLNIGDTIEISPTFHNRIAHNIRTFNFHFIPPKYLQINYKTFQILVVSRIDRINNATIYPFWLDFPTFIQSLKN